MPRPLGSRPCVPLLADARLHRVVVPALLLFTAFRAVTSLRSDSVTFDEPFHLVAGVNAWRNADYRLSPDHPPLGRMWAALPVLFMHYNWPGPDNEAWQDARTAQFAVEWLFELNDGQRLVVAGRYMMVVLLLATCLTVYATARTLFGPVAGLLALVLAALSPTLLAHGRLITTDMPITLGTALTLLTFSLLLRRAAWPRLLAAVLALAATSLAKFSWPLVVPALGVMAVWAVLGRRPIEVPTGQRSAARAAPHEPMRMLTRRRDRAALVLGVSLFLGLAVWAGIWTGSRWHVTILAPLTPDADPIAIAQLKRAKDVVINDWQIALRNPDGTPRPLAPFLQWVARTRLLPEGYLFGLARTLFLVGQHEAYLMGAYSDTGWRSYFPIAFALKTPLATQLLLAAGIVALVLRRARSRDPVLLAGLIVFAAIYGGYAINGRVNIGHRHLLPLYPVFFVLASACAVWLSHRVGRWLVGAAFVWLLGAQLWIHPHYLAYFNELSGGPSRGYRFLVDSNIDWGQDLLRLAAYARAHPAEPIKLAYFGSALPTKYLNCTALPSFFGFEPSAALTAGTYITSVTQLVGAYDVEVRPDFWSVRARQTFGQFAEIAAQRPPPDETPDRRKQREQIVQEYDALRPKRLIARLRDRQPDDRVGYSMLVYRLTDADVEELTRP